MRELKLILGDKPIHEEARRYCQLLSLSRSAGKNTIFLYEFIKYVLEETK